MSAQRTTWTSVGLLLTLLAGSPVFADDTELMLVTPETAAEDKPNILFILDTSGSMKDPVSTLAPYDGTQTYTGDCDSASLYWSDVDIAPDCASDPAPDRFVAKASFVCAAANGQLLGIGSYSDTMVQHRPTDVPDVSRWQELLPGDSTDLVECQADSGVDGDGIDTDALWASNGSDDTVFTSDSALEISWGSAPAAVTYTVYDGNYLNWKNSANVVDLPKIDILKAVTKAVLESITDVNVGVMRFNDNDGGVVIKAMSDLDSSRDDLLTTVDSLDATAATPLAETLYESALYWRGLPAHYGEIVGEHPTDPAALETTEPADYLQPQTNMCSRNFNVLVTDGEPNEDTETPSLIANLPDFPACDGTGQGHCLDDVAAYLGSEDIDPVMDGKQVVTTHTIGFDVDVPILKDTAEESGGTYFLADDVESLALAMLNIISDIKERSLSFTSPSIAVNSFNRTQNLNDLYLTVFSSRTHVHWPGNLKKFAVAGGQIVDATGDAAVNPATGFFFDTAKSIWTEGAADGNDVTLGGAAQLLKPGDRNLYTNKHSDASLTALNNTLTPTNAAAFSLGDFGLTGATGEPSVTDMIRWMRGVDVRDEDSNAKTTVRHAMGDPLHSQPAAVVYGGTAAAPDVVVFTATNDGYLHAINGEDGTELWSFVPKELLGDMNRLYFDPKVNFKHYGIDGTIVPVLNDENNNGIIEAGDGDFVYILFGLRRGGQSYYALDVTDRASPKLLWMKQYPEFGQSWSTPVVARVNIDDTALNDEKAVVIIGGGYDWVHDSPAAPEIPDKLGAGIHMLDLVTGERLWRAGPDDAADLPLSTMTRAIPTSIRVLDLSGDGFADRMYAADLGGQIWRFDISNGQPAASLVAGGVIAQLGANGLTSPTAADTRRFYNSPDIAIFTDPVEGRRFVSISIGSGYRAHPLDNQANDRFFSIRDPDVFNQLTQEEYNAYDVVTISDLENVNGQSGVVLDSDDRGWQFTLPDDQKVLADSVTFDNSIFFVGFSPEPNLSDPCQPSVGRNFLYQVSVVNGDPLPTNFDSEVPNDPDAARVSDLEQSGIAPTPSVLFPGAAADCEGEECNAPPPLACIGVECFDPEFVNNPVRTLWTEEGLE